MSHSELLLLLLFDYYYKKRSYKNAFQVFAMKAFPMQFHVNAG